jgi:cytoskeletal protein RodZ
VEPDRSIIDGGAVEPELTPLSLGELLRRAREARGLTLAQVEQETRIRRAYLEALEADDLGRLPPPVFTRGLARSYALYLGVSAVEASELLNKDEARPDAFGVLPESTPPRLKPTPLVRIVWASAVMVLAVIFSAAIYLGLPAYMSLFSASPARAQATAAPTTVPTATPSPVPAIAPTLAPAPTVGPSATAVPPTPTLSADGRATATVAAGVRGVTVEARTTGRVWSQVEADGEVVFSGILNTSERKTFRAERSVLLHVGDGGLVEVVVNGRSLGPVGARGDVVKTEWTATR